MIKLILIFLFSNLIFIGDGCFCIQCEYEITSRMRLFSSEIIRDQPCFYNQDDYKLSSCSNGRCFTYLKVSYDLRQTTPDMNKFKMSKISIKRFCDQSYKVASRKSECKTIIKDDIYTTDCISICTSSYICNEKNAFSLFIKNRFMNYLPTCESCRMLTNSLNCVKSKKIICNGKCFILKYEDFNKNVIMKKGCITTKENAKEGIGQYLEYGKWNYYLCNAELYSSCNAKPFHIDLSGSINDKEIYNITNSRFVCLECSGILGVTNNDQQSTDCINGIINNMFNVKSCHSNCVTYYIRVNKRKNILRGCEGETVFRYGDETGRADNIIERQTNKSVACSGCSTNFIIRSHVRTYTDIYRIIDDVKYLDECKILCNIVGTNNCVMITYYEVLRICHLMKGLDYRLDYNRANTFRITLEPLQGNCQLVCFSSCMPSERICNNHNYDLLIENWITSLKMDSFFIHNDTHEMKYYGNQQENYKRVVKFSKRNYNVDMAMPVGNNDIPAREIIRCIEKCKIRQLFIPVGINQQDQLNRIQFTTSYSEYFKHKVLKNKKRTSHLIIKDINEFYNILHAKKDNIFESYTTKKFESMTPDEMQKNIQNLEQIRNIKINEKNAGMKFLQKSRIKKKIKREKGIDLKIKNEIKRRSIKFEMKRAAKQLGTVLAIIGGTMFAAFVGHVGISMRFDTDPIPTRNPLLDKKTSIKIVEVLLTTPPMERTPNKLTPESSIENPVVDSNKNIGQFAKLVKMDYLNDRLRGKLYDRIMYFKINPMNDMNEDYPNIPRQKLIQINEDDKKWIPDKQEKIYDIIIFYSLLIIAIIFILTILIQARKMTPSDNFNMTK